MVSKHSLILSFLFLLLTSTLALNVYQYDYEDAAGEDDYDGNNYDWLDQADQVVESSVVKEGWTQKKLQYTSKEYFSYTNFIVEINDPTEQFSAPEMFIFDSAGNKPPTDGTIDDSIELIPHGDAAYGNLKNPDAVDDDEDDGSVFFLKINYVCKKPATRIIGARITVFGETAADKRDVTFYWKKICGSGPRKGFDVDVAEDPEWEERHQVRVVDNGETLTDWKANTPEHIIPMSRWHVTFLLTIREDFGSQAYGEPVVTCSDESIMSVTKAGDASGAGFLSEYDVFQGLKIIHTCRGPKGQATVSVAIPLGSFEPIKFSWIKSCEASTSEGTLEISSKIGGHANVVSKSIPNEQWTGKEPKFIIPATEDKTTFYLRSSGAPISFSHPLVSVIPSHVLKAKVTGDYSQGGLVFKDEAAMDVEYSCLQKGTAVVKVTVPFSEHSDPVEFSWVKECPKFKRTIRQAEPAYLTANKAMALFCFVVGVLGLLGYYSLNSWKKRRAAEQKARLSQQQQTYDD